MMDFFVIDVVFLMVFFLFDVEVSEEEEEGYVYRNNIEVNQFRVYDLVEEEEGFEFDDDDKVKKKKKKQKRDFDEYYMKFIKDYYLDICFDLDNFVYGFIYRQFIFLYVQCDFIICERCF